MCQSFWLLARVLVSMSQGVVAGSQPERVHTDEVHAGGEVADPGSVSRKAPPVQL